MSLFSSILVFTWLTLYGGRTSIKFCFGFFNLLYKRYQAIVNPVTLTPIIIIGSPGLRSIISSCFVICSFKFLHCIAEIRAYWVEPKPFQIDNPRHHYQIA